MIEIENQTHYDATVAYARSIGLFEDADNSNHTLSNRLRYLENYGKRNPTDEDRFRVRLAKDFAPHSFAFTIELRTKDDGWSHFMSGGLLFHGRHDGHGSRAAPTLAVTLEPTAGWQIHT